MVNKFLSLVGGEDAARRTAEVRFGSPTSGSTDERPVFVAPHPSEIVAASLVNATLISSGSANYGAFILTDKGANGQGTDEIGKLESGGVEGRSFDAFDEVEFETLSAEHRILAEGDVVSLKYVPSGHGAYPDEMLVKTEYRRH